jgi:hypothetical protein
MIFHERMFGVPVMKTTGMKMATLEADRARWVVSWCIRTKKTHVFPSTSADQLSAHAKDPVGRVHLPKGDHKIVSPKWKCAVW